MKTAIALALALPLAATGCGKKDDAPKPTVGSAPTGAKVEGCDGEDEVLVKFTGDMGERWCLNILHGGYGDCIDFPPPLTGFYVDFDDPDALEGQSGRGQFQLQISADDLVAGSTLVVSKQKGGEGLAGSVMTRKNADGTESEVKFTSFGWDTWRDKELIAANAGQDGWTTGTITIHAVPAKKCDPYRFSFDLQLHHPKLPAPLKLAASEFEFGR